MSDLLPKLLLKKDEIVYKEVQWYYYVLFLFKKNIVDR